MRERSPPGRATFGLLRHLAAHHRRRSAGAIVLLSLGGFVEGLSVITLLPVVTLLTDDPEPGSASARVEHVLEAVGLPITLPVLLALLVLGIFAKGAFTWMALVRIGVAVNRTAMDLRVRVMRALLRVRWGFLADRPAGELANAVSVEPTVAAAAFQRSWQFVAACVHVFFYGLVAAWVAWEAVAVAAVAGVAVVGMSRGFVRSARDSGSDEATRTRAFVGRMVVAVQGLKPLRAMGRDEPFVQRLAADADALRQAADRRVQSSEILPAFQEAFLALVVAIGLWVGHDVLSWPLASLMVVGFLFWRVAVQVNRANAAWQFVAARAAWFWSLNDLIEAAEAEAEPTGGVAPVPQRFDRITLERVSFAHEGRAVLRAFDLTVPAGQMTVLAGPSGVGKTTVLDLIGGFRHPDAGRVAVDGVPLTDFPIRGWRQRVGYVPQEVTLLNGSVFENVALDDPSLTEADVRRALTLAGAEAFVDRLDEGLDAPIGEQGARLSGGERQRLALARALVHRPALLVLDEPTTALDPATEAEIVRTLVALRGETTLLAVTHGDALQQAADQVVTMTPAAGPD